REQDPTGGEVVNNVVGNVRAGDEVGRVERREIADRAFVRQIGAARVARAGDRFDAVPGDFRDRIVDDLDVPLRQNRVLVAAVLVERAGLHSGIGDADRRAAAL